MSTHQHTSWQRYENACVCGARHYYCTACGDAIERCMEREMFHDMLRDYAEFKATGRWPVGAPVAPADVWDAGFTACAHEDMKQRDDPTYPIHRPNPYRDLPPCGCDWHREREIEP